MQPVFDQQILTAAYQLLPHGPELRLVSDIIALDSRVIHCRVAPTANNPLQTDKSQMASFSCVEYAAQAAAIHGIAMGAHYDPLKPAYIGAVKDICLLQAEYAAAHTITIQATQEYCENDGAIYSFSAYAEDAALITGRLILKK